MKKIFLATPVALAALFSIALTSCGSDSGGGASPTSVATTNIGDLKVGYVLPETGALAHLAPAMIGGYELGVKEINEANAGIQIRTFPGDSGTDPTVAGNTADNHIADGVSVIVGAASSGISLSIIDKIIGQEIVMIAPSNTSPSFTTYLDNGYYFRTATLATLQAKLLTELIIDGGNISTVILHRADDYASQLAIHTENNLIASGAEVARVIEYDHTASSFQAEVQQAAATNADAVLLISFSEGIKILSDLIEAGMGPAAANIFIPDGLVLEDLGERVDPSNPGIVDGVINIGTSTAPANGEATFVQRFRLANPTVTDLIFANHTYDAIIIPALAALQAKSTDPTLIRDQMVAVTKGGEKCNLFADCARLINQGKDIDYDGASGPLDFVDVGESNDGTYDVFIYENGGMRTFVSQQTLSLS